MKHLNTAPINTGFFEVYAKLSKSIRASGIFAQVVSGLTEVGGIYTVAYSNLLPIFPSLAMYMAGGIALIGTAVIELGLRVLAPHTVDAVLYRRFAGLHLPMTISIWLLTAILMATSGIISFSNSKVIVNEFTPPPDQETTNQADSIYQAKTDELAAAYSIDSAAIASRYASQISSAIKASEGQQKAARRELSNLYNKEKRTGQSFATAKDDARQKIADLEAASAEVVAGLEAAKSTDLAAAYTSYKLSIAKVEEAHQIATGEVKAANEESKAGRAATVAGYGSGLGWFTIVCLLIFSAAIILERIHRKGSGIQEKVELSQYDLNPSALVEAWAALRERWQYGLRSRIAAFAEKTPPAPLPTSTAELYDPTQAANISVVLKIEKIADEGSERVIYIEPKRRQIGFQGTGKSTSQPRKPNTNTNTKTETSEHEHQAGPHTEKTPNSCAVKGQEENPNLSDLTQRLKMYKKRLGKHTQKAQKLEKAGKDIPARTLNAIENNRQWVDHYTQLINEA